MNSSMVPPKEGESISYIRKNISIPSRYLW
jgi:hypothetical protein